MAYLATSLELATCTIFAGALRSFTSTMLGQGVHELRNIQGPEPQGKTKNPKTFLEIAGQRHWAGEGDWKGR
eukprot:11083851-Lingulodinium_polyedra.AAC.1